MCSMYNVGSFALVLSCSIISSDTMFLCRSRTFASGSLVEMIILIYFSARLETCRLERNLYHQLTVP
jgi:hypothetical protein